MFCLLILLQRYSCENKMQFSQTFSTNNSCKLVKFNELIGTVQLHCEPGCHRDSLILECFMKMLFQIIWQGIHLLKLKKKYENYCGQTTHSKIVCSHMQIIFTFPVLYAQKVKLYDITLLKFSFLFSPCQKSVHFKAIQFGPLS